MTDLIKILTDLILTNLIKDSYVSHGSFLCQKQIHLSPAERDYGYLKYFQKSFEIDPFYRDQLFERIKYQESERDYFSVSLKPINHLIQIDEQPNLELIEPKWELYKISISFQAIGKSNQNYKLSSVVTFVDEFMDVPRLKKSNHRIFFQNAEGNINMGIFCNDPDVNLYELYWYNQLAMTIDKSLKENEGLISIDEELNTRSCYVELHRAGSLIF